MKKNKIPFFKYFFLIIASIISIYPFYWMLVGSTLNSSQIFSVPPKLFFGTYFIKNYQDLVSKQPIWDAFKNSMIISVTFTILTVYISALVGYTFAKFEFKYKNILFSIILLTMMLPSQVTLIPLFNIIVKLGWQSTPQAIIVPALANIFGVFFMRQNMLSVPRELIESGRVDGASELGIFNRIVLPTSLPALAALGILSFIQQWGNFLWPLIILQDRESTTLPVLLSLMVQRGQQVYYGEVLVGTVIGILPVFIVFLILQKYFISGLYSGSVKG